MSGIKQLSFLLAAFAVTGCIASSDDGSSTEVVQKIPQNEEFTPAAFAKKRFKSFTYSTSGKTYLIYTKRDRLARADKIVTQVTKGKPFTATQADDREVQNMLRNAYRSLGLCDDGLHPGLINLGYGPFLNGTIPSWSAYVRCSEKMQKNI